MSRDDGSMYRWTPKSIDKKAQKDAKDGKHRQIPGWIGPVSPYSTAGKLYNGAYRYHKKRLEEED